MKKAGLIVGLWLLAVAAAVVFMQFPRWVEESQYIQACRDLENGHYESAVGQFEELGDYKDSEEKRLEAKYRFAVSLAAGGYYERTLAVCAELEKEGTYAEALCPVYYDLASVLQERAEVTRAAIAFGKAGDYQNAREQSLTLWKTIARRDTISVNVNAIAIRNDGTMIASTPFLQEQLADWTDIVDIAYCGSRCMFVGLRADGTVLTQFSKADLPLQYTSTGELLAEKVKTWSDIVSISASYYDIYGLRSDGTIISTDPSFRHVEPSNIVEMHATRSFVMGLRIDGTVWCWQDTGVAPIYEEETEIISTALYKISEWEDIVQLEVSDVRVLGVKADGTVVAIGKEEDKQCMVWAWREFGYKIVSVETDYDWTFALREDGTVLKTSCEVIAEDVVTMTCVDSNMFCWGKDGTVRQLYGFPVFPGVTDIRPPQ